MDRSSVLAISKRPTSSIGITDKPRSEACFNDWKRFCFVLHAHRLLATLILLATYPWNALRLAALFGAPRNKKAPSADAGPQSREFPKAFVTIDRSSVDLCRGG